MHTLRGIAVCLLTLMAMAPATFLPAGLTTQPLLPRLPLYFLPCWVARILTLLDPLLIGAQVVVLTALAIPASASYLPPWLTLRRLAGYAGVVGVLAMGVHDRRLQPYTYELNSVLLLSSHWMAGTKGMSSVSIVPIASARFLIGALYFVSGLQKLTPLFSSAAFFILSPFIAFLLPFPTLHGLATSVGLVSGAALAIVVEVGGGMFLMVHALGLPLLFSSLGFLFCNVVAKVMAVLLVLMHVTIFTSLYLTGWNLIVLPWNALHIFLLVRLWLVPYIPASSLISHSHDEEDKGAKVRGQARSRWEHSFVYVAARLYRNPWKRVLYVAILLFVSLGLPLLGVTGFVTEEAIQYNLYSGNLGSGLLLSGPLVDKGGHKDWPLPGSMEDAIIHSELTYRAVYMYTVFQTVDAPRFRQLAGFVCSTLPPDVDPRSHVITLSWLPKIPILSYSIPDSSQRFPLIESRSCRSWSKYICPA